MLPFETITRTNQAEGDMLEPGMKEVLKPGKHGSAAEGTSSCVTDIPSTATEQGLYLVLVEPPTTDSSSPTARLFLGTQVAAKDRPLLLRHGIDSIVCIGTPAFHDQPGGDRTFEYLEIQLLDLPSENLLSRLDEAVSFIRDAFRRGQSVLVNCVFAQSRSAAGMCVCLCVCVLRVFVISASRACRDNLPIIPFADTLL